MEQDHQDFNTEILNILEPFARLPNKGTVNSEYGNLSNHRYV